ncbi:MAG: hypothetical protein LBL57_06990, partial [Tannerella sp.]|nr:hypothetical protein [Tannerella sp.]
CNAARFIRDYTNGREMMDCNKDSTVCTIRHYDIRSDRYPTPARKDPPERLIRQITAADNPVLIVAKLKRKE